MISAWVTLDTPLESCPMKARSIVLFSVLLSVVVPVSSYAEITWVGGASTDVFDEANWDLSSSAVAAVDENVTILDDVRIGPGPFANNPEIPNLGGQVRLQVGDGNTLTVDGAILSPIAGGNDGMGGEPSGDDDAANDGISGPIVNVVNGGQFNPFFMVHDVRVNIDSTSSATFGGGGNPINLSSIDLQPGGVLGFLAETPDAFTTEHLSKVFVNGAPAIDGMNIMLASDGATGSIITAVPEPATGLLAAFACLAFFAFRKKR